MDVVGGRRIVAEMFEDVVNIDCWLHRSQMFIERAIPKKLRFAPESEMWAGFAPKEAKRINKPTVL